MIDQVSNSLPHVRSDQIKAYAVTAKSRAAVAPEIPTVDEAGLRDFHISIWHALWAPKGTPKDIVAKLNGAVVNGLASANVRQRLIALGQEIRPANQQTPETLAAFHRAEVDKWWPIVKTAGIKVE
jgi:tripartite-type tricarboxylate transporter receptor subunit TctC